MGYGSIDRLTITELFRQNKRRAERWHSNDNKWNALEWAGAMCGEAGEAANAAKKLRRLEQGIQSINDVDRHFADKEAACKAIVNEVCDTIMYACLLADSVGIDEYEFESALIETFNAVSRKYSFPERLP